MVRGARVLGLEGEIDRARFEALLNGELPNGVVLKRGQQGKHQPGWDLTFILLSTNRSHRTGMTQPERSLEKPERSNPHAGCCGSRGLDRCAVFAIVRPFKKAFDQVNA